MARNIVKGVMTALLLSLCAASAWADGAVYAMTNALGNNEIKVYHRGADGSLSPVPIQIISTGGGGSGLQLSPIDSLGSAGSLQLDPDHQLLFVVNTGTAAENNGQGAFNTDCRQGTITSFLVAADGTLTFVDRVFSRGLFPNSLAVTKWKDRNLVYVLNAGGAQVAICHGQPDSIGAPNVTGFIADKEGRLKPVGSTLPIDPGPAVGTSGLLSCTAAAAAAFSGLTGAPAGDFQCGLNPPSFLRSPAQVGFSPNGNRLVVTVKGTNSIHVFHVDKDGMLDEPSVFQAPGPAMPNYFGFAFDRDDNLLVTEPFGSAP